MEGKIETDERMKDTSQLTTRFKAEVYESPKITSYTDDEILNQLGPAQTGEGSFGNSFGGGVVGG